MDFPNETLPILFQFRGNVRISENGIDFFKNGSLRILKVYIKNLTLHYKWENKKIRIPGISPVAVCLRNKFIYYIEIWEVGTNE